VANGRADIAVVIPCYDLGRTLRETLESVLCQTRPPMEIVVVDDGSTDLLTRQVLAQLRDFPVRVEQTPHRGANAARNHGIRTTSAPYVLALDADDVLEHTFLEATAARLDADTGLAFAATAIAAFEGASYTWMPRRCDLLHVLVWGVAPFSAFLFRRSVWEVVGGLDESLPRGQDWDLWISALECGYSGVVIEEPLVRYRVRWDSVHHGGVIAGLLGTASEAIFRKHRASIERLGVELLLEKERFYVEILSHQRHLRDRRGAMDQRAHELRGQIEAAGQALVSAGRSRVDWGDLRRLAPLSPFWGVERGRPLDRYYIEAFLEANRADVRGRVLEVKDPAYTDMFGSPAVTERAVLDINAANLLATIVADLTRADSIPDNRFDCFILTQTLHIIYDVRGALTHIYRILAPGGVLLCTLPAVSRVNYEDGGRDKGDYWRFTEASVRKLFAEFFPLANFEVHVFGNVLACTAFLYGLAVHEVTPTELDHHDPWFPLIFAVRAVKPGGLSAEETPGVMVHRSRPAQAGAALLYHRVASTSSDVHRPAVAPTDFRAHMEHLRHHYRPIALDELARAAAAGDIPESAVAITFDDGGVDALDTISSILVELGIPATFFVNSERMDEEHESWWDILERILLGGWPLPPALELRLGDVVRRMPTAENAERSAAHGLIHAALLDASLEERRRILEHLTAWSALHLPPRRSHRPMTGEEVIRLAHNPGHAIGAHTVHHLRLRLQPPEVQAREIVDNKHELETLLGRPVTTFAYPFGEHTQPMEEVVRAAGFDYAVTVERREIRPGVHTLRLPRFEIKGCGGSEFAALMRGIFGHR
jgi:peptidoglycan/xylan/chitin deacetylase (PgdA/CDA1 family)/SAM-dependent methyltransferase